MFTENRSIKSILESLFCLTFTMYVCVLSDTGGSLFAFDWFGNHDMPRSKLDIQTRWENIGNSIAQVTFQLEIVSDDKNVVDINIHSQIDNIWRPFFKSPFFFVLSDNSISCNMKHYSRFSIFLFIFEERTIATRMYVSIKFPFVNVSNYGITNLALLVKCKFLF